MDTQFDTLDKIRDEVHGSLYLMDLGLDKLTGVLTKHRQLSMRANVQGLSSIALTSHAK